MKLCDQTVNQKQCLVAGFNLLCADILSSPTRAGSGVYSQHTSTLTFLEQKPFRGTDCLGAVIRRKLASATNGRVDNTNQQMPNYLKPATEQTFEEGPPSLNEGQGCQTPDRNTYQLASHAEWNLPKTGFIMNSSWPLLFLGFLPPSPSVNMSHHFCHGSLWYVFAWHKLMFVRNQTYCLLQSATGQVKIPVSSCHKPSCGGSQDLLITKCTLSKT